MPNAAPGRTWSGALPESLSPADLRLFDAVFADGLLALPTDLPDLSPLLQRLDALTRADQRGA